MAIELDKVYQSDKYEDEIYQSWEQGGFFNPDKQSLSDSAESYTIILPPPNITDKLHLGHAAMLAIEDLFIRFHRMNGYRTLWLPGTDHAAIATQTAVEKKLKKEQGVSRHELGRDAFLTEVNSFVAVTQSTIIGQMKKMGASLDWSRLAFTLDDDRQAAVREMFCQMYEAGLMYRGERVVNWCPRCASTLADDEVEHKEQKAMLYTFYYSQDCPIAISTTRPETKLGDVAIAVNPSDERYKQYVNKDFVVDFCGVELKLKVIADRNVEAEFGTGALGVTPAHSMVDWQMAEAHGLSVIKVINESAQIHQGFGDYSGLSTLEAREKIVSQLTAAGLMIKAEEIDNKLSVCYRCDTAIEPLPSKQWFVAVDKATERLAGKSLKQAAAEVARLGEIKFMPERFTKRYLDWMDNLRDWCVSRQIWFGHRLPVWYKGEEVFVGRTAPAGEGWLQDSDTLDTWFSSGMWTFSTLGWPAAFANGQKSGDLLNFHPTQVLETGYEIITLWVSRMIMMSLFALGEAPFNKVYLHGMILDQHGKKMSKSKGNGIDPLDMIKLYGTDAVRLSLLTGTTAGNDSRISEDRIATERNFVNKFWNIARYISSSPNFNFLVADSDINYSQLTLADEWILNKLNILITSTTEQIKAYNFSVAGEALKEFTWNDLADWYLEATKFSRGSETDKVLSFVLRTILKLWHPFIPFVTEAIWRELSAKADLIITAWPVATSHNFAQAANFELIKELIVAIRTARSENTIEPAKKLDVIICKNSNIWLNEQVSLIKSLRTGIGELTITDNDNLPADAIVITAAGLTIYLLGAIDKDKEKNRLSKEQEQLLKQISGLEARLASEEFRSKAPADLVAKQNDQLSAAKDQLAKNQSALAKL
jgi:valyl-tRNA synthetase